MDVNRRTLLLSSSIFAANKTPIVAAAGGTLIGVGTAVPLYAEEKGFVTTARFWLEQNSAWLSGAGGIAGLGSFMFSLWSERKKKKLLRNINAKLDQITEHLKVIEAKIDGIAVAIVSLSEAVTELAPAINQDARNRELSVWYETIRAQSYIHLNQPLSTQTIENLVAQTALIVKFEKRPLAIFKIIEACERCLFITSGQHLNIISIWLKEKLVECETTLSDLVIRKETEEAILERNLVEPYVISIDATIAKQPQPPSELYGRIKWTPKSENILVTTYEECRRYGPCAADIECAQRTRREDRSDHQFNASLTNRKNAVLGALNKLDDITADIDAYTIMKDTIVGYLSGLDGEEIEKSVVLTEVEESELLDHIKDRVARSDLEFTSPNAIEMINRGVMERLKGISKKDIPKHHLDLC